VSSKAKEHFVRVSLILFGALVVSATGIVAADGIEPCPSATARRLYAVNEWPKSARLDIYLRYRC
jgi:hypothetical protein